MSSYLTTMSTDGPYRANGSSTTTLKPPPLQLKPPPKRKSKFLYTYTIFQNKEDKGIMKFLKKIVGCRK